MSVHVTNVKIKSEWTDYNKHLNMAYYVLVFDQAWEILLEKFDMGETSAKTTGMSTMVVETNTTYDNEVKENEEVDVYCTFFDHDKKRLHLKCEMIEKKTGKLAATTESISLYIDLEKRKVTELLKPHKIDAKPIPINIIVIVPDLLHRSLSQPKGIAPSPIKRAPSVHRRIS